MFRKVKCYINDGKTLDPLEMNLKKKRFKGDTMFICLFLPLSQQTLKGLKKSYNFHNG